MKRFIRNGALYALAFAGVAVFCSLFSDAFAGSVKPIVAHPVDCMVGGEPGEDPHLRVRPSIKIRPISTPEGEGVHGGGGSVASEREVLVSRKSVRSYRIDCRDTLMWRILLNTLSGVLSR